MDEKTNHVLAARTNVSSCLVSFLGVAVLIAVPISNKISDGVAKASIAIKYNSRKNSFFL